MGLVQLIRCRIFGYLRAALFDGDLDGLANFLKEIFTTEAQSFFAS